MVSGFLGGNRGYRRRPIGDRFLLKSKGLCPNLSQGTYRVVPDMRQPARPERRCHRCPFCAPSGRCLERTVKSGRCGDWIWFVRHGKQIRRLYVRPHDPRTPAQLRSRARLSAASKKYGNSLTGKQQDACVAAGAKLRSRPRLGQSGPLTGQQYSIRRQYALQKAHGNGIRTAIAPQVHQNQKLKCTTWEPRRGASGTAPDRRHLGTGRASPVRQGKALKSSSPALPGAARAPRLRGSGRGPLRTPRPNRYAAPGPPASAGPAKSAYLRRAARKYGGRSARSGPGISARARRGRPPAAAGTGRWSKAGRRGLAVGIDWQRPAARSLANPQL